MQGFMNTEKTNTLTIQTPEGIIFSLQLAGPVTRFLAWLVDLMCIMAISSGLETFSGMIGIFNRDIASAVYILAWFLVSIGYGIIMEWYAGGRTIGKRLLRLRVMDEQGLRLRFSQVVMRNLLRFADSLPAFYLLGGMTCLFSRKGQRLGDIAAGTIVIRNPVIAEPDMGQLLGGKYNSLARYPHLAARLRQHVSVQEARIALQAVLRRDSLDPAARIILFREIAGHFREIVRFPDEDTEGMSDEQYVRNVADILFRQTAA